MHSLILIAITFSLYISLSLFCDMHRYLADVAKTAMMRKLEKCDRDTLYDKAPAWLFEKLGERESAWLSYDDQQSVMFCTLCRTHQMIGIHGKNAFIMGTNNFRPDSLGGLVSFCLY